MGRSMLRQNRTALMLLCGVMYTVSGYGAETDLSQDLPVGDVLEAQQETQAVAADSQSRVEALDDATLAMISEYNRELTRYEDLVTYNDNMRQLLASQGVEKQRLQNELQEIEVIRQSIVPLMVEMVEVLNQFVELDQPILTEERTARVEELGANLNRSDVEIAEKYRRVIEAYQIEAEYGQTIEVYEGSLAVGERELTVDLLRVGRVGLYYLSLDRQSGGLWDPQTAAWRSLNDEQLDAVDFAVRVARKQAPPNLVPLPLWTRGAE